MRPAPGHSKAETLLLLCLQNVGCLELFESIHANKPADRLPKHCLFKAKHGDMADGPGLQIAASQPTPTRHQPDTNPNANHLRTPLPKKAAAALKHHQNESKAANTRCLAMKYKENP
jgi:hypothetical protein